MPTRVMLSDLLASPVNFERGGRQMDVFSSSRAVALERDSMARR